MGSACIHEVNLNRSNTIRNRFRILTEVDRGSARLSASREGHSRNAAALVEGDKLVEVVEIGEHLEIPRDSQNLRRLILIEHYTELQ